MSYHVQVNTYGDPEESFSGNAMIHESEEEAVTAAKDLFFRWTAVKIWRVVDADGVELTRGPK